ncbi:MAG: hypothetical protein ACK4IY_07035 [Chitinophagales bacterium]
MSTLMRNILAVVAGAIVGAGGNMVIILISGSIIAPPEGAEVTTTEGLKKSIHLFQPKHFIMPFLAHAIGTFFGAFLTAKIAATRKMQLALLIGLFFLAGGIANVFILPSPAWFNAVDLIFAYIPMAYFAARIVKN